jgi:hypothetical protein
LCTANTREQKESPDPAHEETGPRLAKLGGACCKEAFGSAPGRIRTSDSRFRKPLLYPLSYRRKAPTV